MSAEPTLEALIKKFSEGGWDSLSASTDQTGADKSKRVSKMQMVSEDVLAVARTPAGRRMIDWIFDQSVRRASFLATSQNSIEQVAAYGLLREGQNSIAAMIVGALRHATGGDISFLTQGESNEHSSSNRPGRFERWRRRARRRLASAWRRFRG
jgi:hypothetical protein